MNKQPVMDSRHYLRNHVGVVFALFLMLAGTSLTAEEGDSLKMWNCLELLDEQTRADLDKCESTFRQRYQLPGEYEKSSEQAKAGLVEQWMRDVGNKDFNKAAQAAAALGICRARNAVEVLETAASTARVHNRVKWVAVRSLGQIGDKRSTPVLIELLDHKNWNVRTYAKVSLAEITGVYFADDKDKWRDWKSSEIPKSPSVSQKPGSHGDLSFYLPDAAGRMVNAQDYEDVPVLIMSGSCWCGGCQQDAEPLRWIAAEYAPKGLQTIRTVAGDNELAALDFQKHYRLPFVQLLDTNRSFEKRHNRNGWTFFMLTDQKGKILYKTNSPREQDWRKLIGILNNTLQKPVANQAVVREGTAYMPATLRRSAETEKSRIYDRFPSLACTPDGKVYVVFTTNRNGFHDVFARVFDGSKWSEDMPVAATDADEYDGTVLVDKKGHAWVSWTSNAGGKKYDIFIASLTDGARATQPVQLTHSDDDAMHPRMACDGQGRIWVAYYKWHKMGRYSRDKEVYLRRLENGKWSEEIQISPTDVPQYEDHSDPAIAAYGNGAVVAWSWDFHPPNKGYPREAEAPTIFMRTVSDRMALGKISSVSGKNIDVTPALAVSESRQIWCAWDSLGRNQRKTLCIGNPRLGRDNPSNKVKALNKPAANVCSPCFAVSRTGGRLTLLWSEKTSDSQWVLKRADLDRSNQWSNTVTVESEGNPRYCSAAYGHQGELWVAYSIETNNGSEVVAKKSGEQTGVNRVEAADESSTSADPLPNTEAIRRLRRAIDEKYSYRDLRGIDWDKTFDLYTPFMEHAKTAREFAEVAARMLARARDMHLWVKIEDETIGGFKRNIPRNYDIDVLRRTLPRWRQHTERVSTGLFDDGIGYIMINSWSVNKPETLQPAFKALRDFADCPGLIIDVRANGGGGEGLARQFAGCFVDHPVVYAKHVYRNAQHPEGWGKIQERILKPNKDRPHYSGKVAVLMSRANMSSCEAFLLMMKQVPKCKLVGDRSYGSSGNPKSFDLGNGVTVWLPSWKALRPDGSCFEGEGIKPDVLVRTARSRQRPRDRVLEAALKALRKP